MELKGKLVYIAGPVTNGGTVSAEDAEERFKQGALEVARLGHRPITPIEICWPVLGKEASKQTWPSFMRLNIRELMECDGIYLLRGWENSRGARLEKLIADGLDMFVLYQEPAEPYRGPINQPCSACSAGDVNLEYHDHDHVAIENRRLTTGQPRRRQ